MNELVGRLASISGIVGVIMFGSGARGEADEYSDIDLLVLFRDRASLREGWDRVFVETGSTSMGVHAIPETLDEFQGGSPVFVERVEEEGRVLFARGPFWPAGARPPGKPFLIISYDLRPLSQPDKMKVLYRLYEGKGSGAVESGGGMKIGSGCVLMPLDQGKELKGYLESAGAKVRTISVLLEEEHPQSRLGGPAAAGPRNRTWRSDATARG